jgi:hypothetical protein
VSTPDERAKARTRLDRMLDTAVIVTPMTHAAALLIEHDGSVDIRTLACRAHTVAALREALDHLEADPSWLKDAGEHDYACPAVTVEPESESPTP